MDFENMGQQDESGDLFNMLQGIKVDDNVEFTQLME